jgi:hypothetical protein
MSESTLVPLLPVLLLALAAPAMAAGSTEDDALMLADTTAEAPAQVKSDWRAFVEMSLGRVSLNQANAPSTSANTQRYSLDVLLDKKISPTLRAVFSNRLDVSHQSGAGGQQSDTINTLKEAYLSWQPQTDRVLDVGRVNARYGVAQGYNPTDFLREGANRSIVSVDPSSIRENRLGTAMLRGQTLWAGGSLTALVAPKLADQPNDSAWSADLGSTNNRTRWLLAASQQLTEGFNPQFMLFGDDQQPVQLGFNAAALLSDSTVAHVEWSGGRGLSQWARALKPLGAADDTAFRNRVAAGFTVTNARKMSLTAEYHYNGAALDNAGWNALRTGAPQAYGLYRLDVQNRLELVSRQAAYLRATWQDAMVTKLDLAAMLRFNLEDNSHLTWLEARYRWDRAELAMQWQLNSGSATSDYGALPQRRNVQLQARYFLE